MAIPSVNLLSNAPGGNVNAAMKENNALALDMLKRKFYAPNIQSEIDSRNSLTEGQKILNQYMPEKLQAANAFAQLQNQFYAPNIQSEIASRNALTQKYNTMTPLEAEELRLKNKFYPQATQAEINWKNSGGTSGSAGSKDILQLQRQLQNEHPEWSPEMANQAASAYISGDEALADGTPLPPASGIVNSFVSQIVKRGTTAPIVTNSIKGNQAEAELTVLNDYATKGLAPYGDTYLGYSPAQIMDSFKRDPESQKRLGKFIASQALQYEAAQQRIRLANGQPGVTSTEELMKLSGQLIKTKFPQLSGQARQEATRFLDEALREGLKARKAVRIDAGSLNTKIPRVKEQPKHNLEDYEVPEGSVMLYKGGIPYFFPQELVDEKLSKGYSYE